MHFTEHAMETAATSEILRCHEFGMALIELSRARVLQLWKGGAYHAQLKADATPVTEVDLQVEELVREKILHQFPDHGVCGEEYGLENADSEFLWTIDPIDGTQSLMHGIPTFGTLLGLRFRGEAVLGFIDHPALNIFTEGGRGLGVRRNGQLLTISDIVLPPSGKLPHNEVIAISNRDIFNRSGAEATFDALTAFHPAARVYYDCFAHSLTIAGSIAATVEYNLATWDLTPSEALIQAVGGAWVSFSPAAKHAPKNFHNAVFGKPNAVDAIVAFLTKNGL